MTKQPPTQTLDQLIARINRASNRQGFFLIAIASLLIVSFFANHYFYVHYNILP